MSFEKEEIAKTEAPVCDSVEAHENVIAEVLPHLPQEEDLSDLADLYKIFGDSTRIKILYALFEHEMCVCDIAALLGMTVSAVSHQLKILKSNKLIKNRREGKTIYYSLDDDHVRSIINLGIEHLGEKR